MRKTLLMAAAMCVVLSVPALAQDSRAWGGLGDAKEQGYVGERYDGYVGPVRDDVPDDVISGIEEVNGERLQHYQDIAEKNNLDVGTVQNMVGEKIMGMTPPGQYVMPQDGEWVQKPEGERQPSRIVPMDDEGF